MKLQSINENIDYTPKCDARFGDCSLETYKVAKKAVDKGVTNFIVVNGMVEVNGQIFPHTWIQYNGKIIDVTVSQFKGAEINYNPPDEYHDEVNGSDFVADFEEEYGSIL